jgi:hypothetical protein
MSKTDTQCHYEDSAIITVCCKNNPKEGKSVERFDLYSKHTPMTVGLYVELCKELGYPRSKACGDINWDLERGFIEVKKKD